MLSTRLYRFKAPKTILSSLKIAAIPGGFHMGVVIQVVHLGRIC